MMKGKTTILKRFQYYGKRGIEWTKWFRCNDNQERWQLKNKLKNEYKVEN